MNSAEAAGEKPILSPFNNLIPSLESALRAPLPGPIGQLALHSAQNKQDYEARIESFKQSTEGTRYSSVLILLYEKEGQVYLPLIRRPDYEGVHSGQIALPGGKVEAFDVDHIATALRETEEEIGIPPQEVKILGTLSPVYIPPSRFHVDVVIGYASVPPVFKPDPVEVAALLEFPLAHLFNHSAIEERVVGAASHWKMKTPGYLFEDHFIWGATSLMLTELREILKGL